MSVSAIIVTRGDVELDRIMDSLRDCVDEILVWDNSGTLQLYWPQPPGSFRMIKVVSDFAVYGRYAAIEYASGELIYVQDDDCLHTPEGVREIVNKWNQANESHQFMSTDPTPWGGVVCNMPANFRHSFYQEHALVGFGASFHRDAPKNAFLRFARVVPKLGLSNYGWWLPGFGNDHFLRTCDIAFTALTPRVLVDVPYEDLPWASADNRMWKQEGHRDERGKMLDLVLKVRDG